MLCHTCIVSAIHVGKGRFTTILFKLLFCLHCVFCKLSDLPSYMAKYMNTANMEQLFHEDRIEVPRAMPIDAGPSSGVISPQVIEFR